MRKYLLLMTVLILTLALGVPTALAQRGRGGGRGGGGRPSMNRSPSMSRPSSSRPSVSRPATGMRPSTRPTTQNRPGASQRPSAINRPTTGQRPTRPGGSTRPSIDRGKLQGSMGPGSGQRPTMPDWFKPGASQLPNTRPGSTRPGSPTTGQLPWRPGNVERPAQLPAGGNRPGTGKPPGLGGPGQLPGTRPPVTDKPGKPGRPPGSRPPGFRPPHDHPSRPWHPGYPGYRPPNYWWRWTTAGAITGWIAHSWVNPIYYSYGPGGTVYYDNNVVYVNGQPYGSAQEYYDEAAKVAESVPEMTDAQAEKTEWMPLGVYAITSEGVNASNMYLQLAVSKDGMIGGTFYNETTGATHPVEGMVDQKTQCAYWKAADGTNSQIVMETGIYNLTQDQTNVLVHFGPEQTQTWVMVRLEESKQPEKVKSGSF